MPAWQTVHTELALVMLPTKFGSQRHAVTVALPASVPVSDLLKPEVRGNYLPRVVAFAGQEMQPDFRSELSIYLPRAHAMHMAGLIFPRRQLWPVPGDRV